MSDSTAPSRPVFARTLANGLTVLLRESHDAPVAGFWVWYRVGSRDELPGLTGVSHWVEHMQFKGTPSRAKGSIFRDVSKFGGTMNAMTSHDWTAYYETLPIDRLDLSLEIESDRMTNSLFDPAEIESERTVIISERQGSENNPGYVLYEDLVGTAFRAHPYRHMVIGYENDLRSITRDDLFNHYQRYYQPNNAVIAAAGDFDAEALFAKIEASFGSIPAGDEPPRPRALEPEQLGERRITLRRPAPTSYLRMAYRAPDARHADTPALLVLDAVLSGSSGMGRSARLYKALVSGGLARSAGSDFSLTLDPYLFMVAASALPGVELERIEEAIERELARVRDEVVPDGELARAIKQVKAGHVYSEEGVTNQAFWLGQMEIIDTHTRADTFVAELEAVTPTDIQRVAQSYLIDKNRTVGWLIPTGDGGGEAEVEADAAATPKRWWAFSDGPKQVSTAGAGATVQSRWAPLERLTLPGGIVVLGQARPTSPSVVARLRIGSGAVNDPEGKDGLAAFTGRMLARGTATRTYEAFNEATDGLGATVGVDVGRLHTEVSIRCLREDFPTVLDIAADILRNPSFPEEEIAKVRQELSASIREADNDTRSVADRALRQLLYPAGHAFSRRVSGELDSVAEITREDLVAFHAARFGAGVMTVAIVGGVEDIDSAAALIGERFSDWSVAVTPNPVIDGGVAPPSSQREVRVVPGKTQSDIAIGFPTVSRSHPDYFALDTANLILGRLGLMGRLGANVRDQQGLAYYAYSQIEPGRGGSIWSSRAGINPENVERAISSITAEVERLRTDPVDAEELADSQAYMTGILPLAFETSDGVAATLLNIEYFDLGLDYLERYPGIINALTLDDLQRAAQTHLDPSRLTIGIAGPPLATPASEGTPS